LNTAVHKMTAMPGGIWRFVQTDKGGKEYAFHGVYHEITIPERLVYTSEYEGMPGHIALYTEDLNEEDGSTIITTRVVFQSVEDRDQLLQWGMEEGVREMTRRLNELLAKENLQESKVPIMERLEENGECITISRTFDAGREEVWERWTDPDEYMCWWGPKDFTSPYARFDLRPGGKYLSCMRGPDGKEYWDTGQYEEINNLNRIVYTDYFADAHGNIVPPSYYGMKGDQPIEMAVEVRLEDIGGKTRMTLEHCGLTDHEMLNQAKAGWNQSFDKLAECLR
jgi:uncharacterized protein YndB with AHSA1/START domain